MSEEIAGLTVGEPCPLTVPRATGVVDFLRGHGSSLLIGLEGISKFERQGFRKGDLRVGIVRDRSRIRLLFKFTYKGRDLLSIDGNFDSRLIPSSEFDPVQWLDDWEEETRLAFSTILVDTFGAKSSPTMVGGCVGGIVCALRYSTLPLAVGREFREGVRDQVERVEPSGAFLSWDTVPPEVLFERAIVSGRVGD
jgi:hypothetical protein